MLHIFFCVLLMSESVLRQKIRNSFSEKRPLHTGDSFASETFGFISYIFHMHQLFLTDAPLLTGWKSCAYYRMVLIP